MHEREFGIQGTGQFHGKIDAARLKSPTMEKTG